MCVRACVRACACAVFSLLCAARPAFCDQGCFTPTVQPGVPRVAAAVLLLLANGREVRLGKGQALWELLPRQPADRELCLWAGHPER